MSDEKVPGHMSSILTTKCKECGHIAQYEAHTVLHKPGEEWIQTCRNDKCPKPDTRMSVIIQVEKGTWV